MRTFALALAIISLLIRPSLIEAQKYANDESLVLYLPFDEGEGDTTFDASIFGNHGRLEAPQWVKGKFGMALEFNGDGDVVTVDTKNSDELQLHQSEGTVECWFLMEGKGNSTFPRLIAKESITNDCDCDKGRGGYTLRLKRFDPVHNLQLSVEKGSGKINKEKKEAIVKNDVWYHGAGTWKEGEHLVYLNGKVVNKDNAVKEFPLEDRKNDLRIGGTLAGFRFFQGIIDEVRIWNRVLSVGEIRDNMTLGFGQLMSVSPDGLLTTTWGKIKASR